MTFKIFSVGKSKETRGNAGLRNKDLPRAGGKKLFWNRTEILEIIQQFSWNVGRINTNPERTSLKNEG